MASFLKLENKKFFSDLLKVFSNKRQVTFEISEETMTISSIEQPYIYLSLDKSLFKISSPISFTIRVDELYKNVNLLNSPFVLLAESFRIIDFRGIEYTTELETIVNLTSNSNANYTFIDIPFINPINSHYMSRSQFPTRIIVPKESLKNFLTGTVRYSIANGQLQVSKQTTEYEETMEITCDILEASHLSFYCRNDWIEPALEIYDIIHTVLFCFSDGLLSIKFLFKDQNEAYLEFQIVEVYDNIG